MTWSVNVIREPDGKARIKLLYSEYDADMNHLLSTEATRLANQLLIASAECARINNPPKQFWK